MKKKLILMGWMASMLSIGVAQENKPDSIVIKVGEASKVIFAIDKKDLPILKYYDFQALMDDMIKKLEEQDATQLNTPSTDYLKSDNNAGVSNSDQAEPTYEWPRDDDDDDRWRDRDRDDSGWVTYEGNDRSYRNELRGERHRSRRTYHSITFDIGTNNLLNNGKFPDSNNDLYTIKPFGSWYVGINSIQRTRLGGKFFLEWGGGVSWYNFKFQNDKTIVGKDNVGVIFAEDTRDLDFKKSKLTASFVNVSIVPVIDFGGNRRKPMLFDSYHSNSFRIGIGPYAGYRIDSYTKQVFNENNDKKRDRNHDNFFIDNIRYGARLQLGFEDVDLFFNYDMNELFSEGRGPSLNAFSFGVTF